MNTDKLYIVYGHINESGDEDTWIEEIFDNEKQASDCCKYLNMTNTQKNVTFYLSQRNGLCHYDYTSDLKELLKEKIIDYKKKLETDRKETFMNNKKLTKNAIKCNHCGDIIESKHVHDFVECNCGLVFVDGGLEYARRGFKYSTDDFEDLSEWEEVSDEDIYGKSNFNN